MREKILTGIRIIDLSRFYAGPFCTMLLGDLGADVVKIEQPGTGDPTRLQGPPSFADMSMSFLAANRNKRSIVLDLKSDGGKELAYRLALTADILVENFRPGVVDRMGLGYEKLSAENPKIIYVTMSGMGADGPDSAKGAFDLTVQAEGGYMSITGDRNGKPIKLGTSAFDLICAQYAMGATTAALYQREKTGLGQRIETSLFESGITFLVDAGIEYLITGKNREKWGSEHAGQAPYKAFETADGWMVIGGGFQNLFEAFMRVIKREDLIDDSRFLKLTDRVANRDDLNTIIDAEVKKHKMAELMEKLSAAKVPCAPVNDMAQVFAHPQALHRGMIQHLEHPDYGQVPQIGPAVKYSAFDVVADWTAPPLVGEHTREVLRDWLGLSGDELARAVDNAAR